MTIRNFKARGVRSPPYNQMGIFNGLNGTYFRFLQLGLPLFLMLSVVASASETGTTVGILLTQTQTPALGYQPPAKSHSDQPNTAKPAHFDNPTPPAPKFTLNGQFVTSDSHVVLSSHPFISSVIPVIPSPRTTTFYDSHIGFKKMTEKGAVETSLTPSMSTSASEFTLAIAPVPTSTTTPHLHQSQVTVPDKGSDINLLRKLQLWSSNQSAKLNLTQEHQDLLRIEPKPNMTTGSSSSWRFISTAASADLLVTPKIQMITDRINTATTKSRNGQITSTTALPPHHHSNINPIRRLQVIYPEWLSAGGVYPDDTNANDNGTAVDYFSEVDPPDFNDGQQLEQQQNPNSGSGFSDPGEAQEENPSRQESFLSSAYNRRIRFNKDTGSAETESESDMPEREMSQGHSSNAQKHSQANSLNDQNQNQRSRESFVSEARAATRSPQDGLQFPPIQLDPDNGLADVISRGRIDSVKYVYFGDKFNDYHKEEIAGRIIQAVGGVVAAIAQVLTVLGAAKCIRKGGSYSTPPVQLHIGFALLISNLLLLLAVHATEPADVCASVAVILHYLHLVIGCWLLGHTVQTYRTLQRQVNAPNLLTPDASTELIVPFGQRTNSATTLPYCAITWAAPIPFILTSYLVSPDGYETRSYCWMSLEKGMLVSFIVPVFLLIGLNTSLVVLSLRHLLALQKLCTAGSNRAEHSRTSEILAHRLHYPNSIDEDSGITMDMEWSEFLPSSPAQAHHLSNFGK